MKTQKQIDIADTLQSLEALQATIDTANEARRTLLAAFTEAHCPLKVGDLLEVPKEAHTSEGKPCCVTRTFTRTDYWDKLEFRITADVFRKDGSKGQRSVNWSIPVKP